MYRWRALFWIAVAGCSAGGHDHTLSSGSKEPAQRGTIRGIFLDAGVQAEPARVDAGRHTVGTAVTTPAMRTGTKDPGAPTHADSDDAGPASMHPQDAGRIDAATPDGTLDAAVPADTGAKDSGKDAGSGSLRPDDVRSELVMTLGELLQRRPSNAGTIVELAVQVNSGAVLSPASVVNLLSLIDRSFNCDGDEARACELSCAYVTGSCQSCVAAQSCRNELARACGPSAVLCR